MQISFDRLRTHKGLAQTDQAFIGMQPDPEDVGKLPQAQGLNLSDLHGSS